MNEHKRTAFSIIPTLIFTGFVALGRAQDVSIPDPGLNAAIREALQKPAGPLTEQDLLSLINLDARRRNIGSLEGLEAARNLTSLDLNANRLGTFSYPAALTKLRVLNLGLNSLTNCTLLDGLTNLTALILENNGLTNFNFPAGLTALNTLDLKGNQLTGFSLPSNLTSVIFLDVGFNLLTNCTLPNGLTNLDTLDLAGNLLKSITLPDGLNNLIDLELSQNQLTSLSLPAGLTNLLALNLFFNQLTNLTLPADLKNLTVLHLDNNKFTSLNLPLSLTHLLFLDLRANQLVNFALPPELNALTFLDIGENQLTNVILPATLGHLNLLRLSGNINLTRLILPPGMTNLTGLFLRFNQLTNLTLPNDLFHLVQMDVLGNQLALLDLPAGLANLATLVVSGNQLTNLTLPPDLTKLTSLVLNGNPLTTLVLSEPLAASLADTIASVQEQGVSVFTYPLAIQLIRIQQPIGAFQFVISGPPGDYTILSSTDLTTWSVLRTTINQLGKVVFTDGTAHLSPQKFYRARLQGPPANMVFIPPNTFIMGSPTNELHRQANEGPQTTVTLTRGFWIGKYEVTQGEYSEVTGTNPSFFPGDLSRPISSVSWPDATNYCWQLTQRELAAGRIPPGSQYRLPTEAEWECAARAGTTTRFSYGDDPDYISLTNHAWYFINSSLTVHPVGQKLSNPWGLYDMEGNVWEWCQDWLGDLPGGAVTDPQGPPSNPIGLKVARGGTYDFAEPDCRSARRFSFGNHPALTDTDLGFRVVLVMGP